MKNKSKKVLLIIRDGWGYSPDRKYNMIAQANTPYTDYLEEKYPTTLLHASGESVGLPAGFFGNSEVGHMTIGAGRVLEQSLLRINKSIDDESFFENREFLKAISIVKKNKSKLNLIGILQKEGVHGQFSHLIALLELAKQQGLKKDDVYVHIMTDGRDMEQQHAVHYLIDLEKEIKRIGIGMIMTLSGRYFGMNRNENWDRTKKYYNILVGRHCEQSTVVSGIDSEKTFLNPIKFLEKKYSDSEFSDEFLEPIRHINFSGIKNNDAIIFYNFRKDRARQLTRVFTEKDFSKFEILHSDIHFVTMTEYHNGIKYVAYPDIAIPNILGKILEDNNKTQLRISETEKYAHVTFFFDGGEDYDFIGEKKILIPSPNVATFDLQPEMASLEVTEKLIFEIENIEQDFILCNFPNADMVGHTGDFDAMKNGISAIDKSLEKIIPIALENNYVIILAADHGNAEYKHANHKTSHTNNLIPLTLISNSEEYKNIILNEGYGLKNIAATILKILKINIEKQYEKSLF